MGNTEKIKFNKEALDFLNNTLPKIKNKKEAEMFLKDLMSSTEIKAVARRLLSVKKLYNGKTYAQINFESSLSMGVINKMHFKTKGSKVLKKLLS